MRRWLTAAVLVSAMMVAACAKAPAPSPVPGPSGPVAQGTLVKAAAPTAGSASGPTSALATPINDFGFNLLRTRETAPNHGPQTVISPLSVHVDLAMVANGAADSTLKQMLGTLKLTQLGQTPSNEQYANLLTRLDKSGEVTVTIANSLWIDQGFPVESAFIDTNRRYFGAEQRMLDLQTQQAVTDINRWVFSATKGRIPTLLTEIPPGDAVMYVINATYFKGDWVSPFEKSATTTGTFHATAGTEQVPLMRQTESFRYAENPSLQAVELPYRGNALSMLVLLPRESSSLDSLVASLSAGSFADIRSSLEETRVALTLPKLEVSWSASLAKDLAALGLDSAFSPDTAEFGRMSATKGVFISDVLHKTYLRVDEKGTEAAAVTSTEMATTAAPVAPPVTMTVDRPYLMAIVDNESGAVLFLAAVHQVSR